MRSYRKYSEVYDFVLARAIAGKERSSRSPTKKHSIPNRRDNVRGVALAIPPFIEIFFVFRVLRFGTEQHISK